MTSGQDVSEYLDIFGLVKSYFSSFFGEKKIKKIENFFFVVLRKPQRIRRFACLQDCLLTLTWHLAPSSLLIYLLIYLTYFTCNISEELKNLEVKLLLSEVGKRQRE